jgi:hypothetical protein
MGREQLNARSNELIVNIGKMKNFMEPILQFGENSVFSWGPKATFTETIAAEPFLELVEGDWGPLLAGIAIERDRS